VLKKTRTILVLPAILLYAAMSQANFAQTPQPKGFVQMDRVTASRATNNGIEIRCGEALLSITALRDDALRLRVGPAGVYPEDASWAVLPEARTATVQVTPEESSASVGFHTGKLHVTIQKNPLQVTIADLDGHILSQDLPGRPIEFHGGNFRLYRQSPGDEHYFALGDKPGPLDRRNQAFSNWNTDAFGWQESTDPIYKSIPFFMSYRRGISAGFFLDNTWKSSFDFNKEYRDGYSFGAENGPLDLYILYGPTPKEVVEKWAWLTGRTPLPPMWALGYQQSRYSYYPESEVRRIASRLRAEKIPTDVLWLDIDYQFKNRPFTVDPERFPHFDQMLADLRAEHLHTIAITDLHIAKVEDGSYKPYEQGLQGNHFVHNPDGSVYVGPVWPGPAVFPDFTRAESRAWWGSLYADFVHKGIAGFWNDMNEPAVFVPSKTMPDDIIHRIEEPGFRTRTASHLEIHNLFGMENSRATFEGLQKLQPDGRPFVMTRASYAGGQRYASTWTGDNSSNWNHLRQTVPQLLNLGLSGFAMSGADVGGFAFSPQPELLTRWLQLAAFQPIDRDHTAIGTMPQEPWENGTPEDVKLRREAIEERYRLMPYLYTAAEEMSRTGLPIMRPLFLEFPQASADGLPADLPNGNSFLFGADLLVAQSPYPDEMDDYTVALPQGGWYNYWTGEKVANFANRQAIDNNPAQFPEVAVRRTMTLPVFARAGAILPEQPLVQSTDEKPQGALTLRVYPPEANSKACQGSLYLDDGVSRAYEKGEFLRESFTCKATAQGLTVSIAPREGRFTPWWTQLAVEVYGASHPATSVKTGAGKLTAGFDSEHHRITALLPDDGKGVQIEIVY
jgi:alpha-glucosidase